MALAYDNSAVFNPGSPVTTGSITLTTSQSNDLIIVIAMGGSNIPAISTPTDNFNGGGGLTWTVFTNLNNRNNGAASTAAWWAKAPNPITSGSVTVTWSPSDLVYLIALAVSGADLVSPEDGNASLPRVFDSPNYTFSTTNANTLAFAWNDGGTSAPSASGWSYIRSTSTIQNAYAIYSAPQSSLVVNPWGTFNGGFTCLTAIKAAAGAALAPALSGGFARIRQGGPLSMRGAQPFTAGLPTAPAAPSITGGTLPFMGVG